MKFKNGCVVIILAVFAAGLGVGYYLKTNNKPAAVVIREPVYEEAPAEARAGTGSATLYGRIEKISLNDKSGSVTFRLVEWVRGSDNQEQAALETGACTLERIENDECLPNPFFIRDTKKEIILSLSTDVDIEVLSPGPDGAVKQDASGNTIFRKITLLELSKIIENKQFADVVPFIFTTTHGVISKIQEQYVP